ncbi:hypothetical protein PsYK624_090830 [Phanerochaete sordida]|uniref:Uncharacterized protein n=1 Tax=Phanerochaete sordida TaxID=48140 RepID=A0A9P3GEL4_9APHY|nr:hypothetical protein PsYK624_090830 [Phanerochaete sordida]
MNYSTTQQQMIPGIIVPQQVYPLPAGQTADGLLPPVQFFCNDYLGIHLDTLPLQQLVNANDQRYLSMTNNRVSLRVLWPGYDTWHFGNALDATDGQKRTRSIAEIAQQVAERVREFYNEQVTADGGVADWSLKKIQFKSLYLVELRNVSRGSWQPVICCRVE